MLTSILKDMKLSTYEATMSSANDEFDPEAYIGTLENKGVGLAELHNSEDKVDPRALDRGPGPAAADHRR